MTAKAAPELSVVLATPDNYDTIRTTIQYLCAQTARSRMEVVIVTPSAECLRLNAMEMGAFQSYEVVEVGEILSVGCANAAGVRRAAAPVVALAEDHAFPDPSWAEALIAAHREPWAAVGPVIRNANPETIASWADLLIAYAPWLAPSRGGVFDHLPGHNSSYKRDVLLRYDSKLEAMMDAESVLHWDLQAKGYCLFLEPAAQVSHMNFGTLTSILPSQFLSGRVFAASRAGTWGAVRRLGYVFGAPMIPLIRLRRILGQTRRSGNWDTLPAGVVPILTIALLASALGEMVGYALGANQGVRRKLAAFEFHRIRHQPTHAGQPMLQGSSEPF